MVPEGSCEITLEHLPDDFADDARRPSRTAPPGPARDDPRPAATRSLEDLELDAMRQALQAAGGNLTQAARQLGVSRNTLYRRLRWSRQGPA